MNLILKLYALVGAISLCSSVIYANDTNEQIIQPAHSSTSSSTSEPKTSTIQPAPSSTSSSTSEPKTSTIQPAPSLTSSATDTKTHSEITYEERLKEWNENYFKNVEYTFHQSCNNHEKPKKNKALKKLSKALCCDEDKPVYLITVTAPLNTDNKVYDFSCCDHTKPYKEQNFLTEQAFKGYRIIYDIGFILQHLCSANMPKEVNQHLLRLRSELAGCAKLVLFNEFFFGRQYICTNTFMHTLYPYISTGCDKTLFYLHSAFSNNPDSSLIECYSDDKRLSYFTSGLKPSLDSNKPLGQNISYSVHNGTALTYYNKASFCREFNGNLAGYLYGRGYDLPIALDNPVEDALSLQKTLLENIGTEICFDLFCKVRRMNNWSNDNGKSQIGLLLLQSGCIDPVGRRIYSDDVTDSKNINNLPISTANRDIYILQADASYNPPAGSHLFKIDSTGGPVLYDPYCTIDLSERCPGLKITIYKVD